VKSLLFFLLLLCLVLDARKLEIYTEESKPANFTQDGVLTGLSTDVVYEIQKRIKDKTKIEVLPWKRAYTYATTKENVLLFSLTRTKDRENIFSWIGPLLRIEWALYGKKNSGINLSSLEEARYVNKIGTYMDDAREKRKMVNALKIMDQEAASKLTPFFA